MYFLILFGDWKLLFYDEKLFNIFLYLCIYFVQKTAELVLERVSLLFNGWLQRVVPLLVEKHFLLFFRSVFKVLSHFNDLIFA